MSQNWYLLAFGVELGPMSWDDLLERAARGDLQYRSQVRRGEAGPFVPASDVPGLFPLQAAERPDEAAWYCEVLGSQLGPMPWDDLLALAERGTLRSDAPVRRGDEAWMAAKSVSGLIRSSDTAERASHVTAGAADDLFGDLLADLRSDPAPVPPAPVAAPPATVPSGPVHSDRAPLASFEPAPALQSPQPEGSEPDEHVVDTPPIAPAAMAPASIKDTSSPKAKPTPVSRPKKAAGRPQVRIGMRVSGRMVAVLAGVLLVGCVGYAGWKLIGRAGSARPDYQQIAVLYRQVHEQIKQYRDAPRSNSAAGLQFQCSRTVGALRKQVQALSNDGTASKLAEAGTQLSQMLANCQATPESAEGTAYADSEQRFLSILDSLPAGGAANR
ncbi:MAG TPA: GYF domain-containing protein [Pirellulales bacterium]|nr:GYF domain-containing protein [Pirellulales bacterium]